MLARIWYDLILPAASIAVGLVVWAALSAVLASPLLFLHLPEGVPVLWVLGAAFVGLYVTGIIMRGPIIQWWKVRPGSRTLGKTRKGVTRES
jgi:hypothetical protein